jgi:hypothetical protein
MQKPVAIGVFLLGLVAGCAFTQDFVAPEAPAPAPGEDGSASPSTLPEGGACVDTRSDPESCGACGHSCLGGACHAGQCGAIELASGLGDSGGPNGTSASDGGVPTGPGSVIADATHVYWVQPNALMRIPVGGGKPERFAAHAGLSVTAKLVMTKDAIYLAAIGAELLRVTKVDSQVTVLGKDMLDFAIAGNDLYIAHRDGIIGSIHRCPLSGCPAPLPAPLLDDSVEPNHTIDGVAAQDGFFFVAMATGTATSRPLLEKYDRVTGAMLATIGSHADSYSQPATDGTTVFTASYRYIIASPVEPKPDTDISGDKYIVSGDDVRVLTFSLDADDIYWAEGWGPRRVVRCPKKGCTTPEALWVSTLGSDTQKDWWGTEAADGALAVTTNDDAIFFTTGDGRVMKLAKPPLNRSLPTTP